MSLNDGWWIVLLVVVIVLFAAAYGLYGRRGSQISAHPQSSEHRGGAPGTERPTADQEYAERAEDERDER